MVPVAGGGGAGARGAGGRARAGRVRHAEEGGRVGGRGSRVETLLAIESLGSDERWIFLSNAPLRTPLDEMGKAASRRHLIEEVFENAKGG